MQRIEVEIPVGPLLGGEIMLPDDAKIAALLHQGAGVHDRDGNMPAVGFKSTLYRRVAQELAARGIATLRFDKRGSGKARFEPQSYTLPQRVDDARAGLRLLRKHTPKLPHLLIGHSEGALVVAKLAQREAVAGVVSLCAPAGNVFELFRHRARRRAERASGTQKTRAELAIEYCEKLEEFFRQGAGLTPEQFVDFSRPYADAGYDGWESYEWLAGHWAEYLKSDPPKHGRKMLVVQGGRDARLWPDNDRRWEEWCREKELADYVRIDHMGHDLNDARRKHFRVDNDVLDIVTEWTGARSVSDG